MRCRSSLVSGQAELIVGPNGSSPLSDTKVFAFAKIRVVPRSLRLRPFYVDEGFFIFVYHRKEGFTMKEKLEALRGCDAHFTVILSRVDEKTYKALGIHTTSEAKFERK